MTLEKGPDGKAQIVLLGAEPSAKQAAAARNQQGSGLMMAKVPQKAPTGLFALEPPQPVLFQ